MNSRISVVINTLNEEKNIRSCLECLRWSDEIVVVDMYSDDLTVEIAKEYTDKVFLHDRIMYFDAARQFAVEQATGDWILIVDADERIPKKLGMYLRHIACSNSEFDIYMVPRKNYILGKWIQYSGWNSDHQMRFFKKGTLNFTGELHKFFNPTGTIGHLEEIKAGSIIHFNYLDSWQFIERLNKYTTIESCQLSEKKEKFKLQYLFTKPFVEFYDRFIRFRGYRDGVIGFLLSSYMAFYRFLTWAKYWEIVNKIAPQATYDEINKKIIEEYKS